MATDLADNVEARAREEGVSPSTFDQLFGVVVQFTICMRHSQRSKRRPVILKDGTACS
jgi:hypothetical protein